MDKNVLAARYEYLSLLEYGLGEWGVEDPEERKAMASLLKAVSRYRRYTVAKYAESLPEKPLPAVYDKAYGVAQQAKKEGLSYEEAQVRVDQLGKAS